MNIKFRAWDYDEKRMWHVRALLLDQQVAWLVEFGEEGENEQAYPCSFENCHLMQSTGVFSTFTQDELFEDDVFSWTYFDEFEDNGKARIVYRDGCWKLLDIKTGKEVWDSLFDCLENCTVFLCGNIYENYELTEENE